MARLERGLIQVYTGDGKGKTTAALGLAVRAIGAGLRVLVIQFLKGGHFTSELATLPRLGTDIKLLRFAPKATPFSMGAGGPAEEDRKAVQEAWQAAKRAIASGEWDIVILDEINNCMHAGLLDTAEVLNVLASRPKHVEIVCTGRGAPPQLCNAADLVTEMRKIKHPYDAGIGARQGIEY